MSNMKPSRVPVYPPNPERSARAATQQRILSEPMGPNNPSSEELSAYIVEVKGDVTAVIPPAVVNLITQLVDAIDRLEPRIRAEAIKLVIAELTKRLAG